MAKKKSKKRKSTTSRRRVGALSASSPIVQYAPIVAGFLFGEKVNAKIDTLLKGKVDGKILGAAEAGIGGYLAFGGKGGNAKGAMIKKVAGGFLLGMGAKKLMTSLNIGALGGYGDVPVLSGKRRMAGYGDVPVLGKVGAYITSGQVNGYTVPGQVNNVANVMSGITVSDKGTHCME